jgi:hypothetical protein
MWLIPFDIVIFHAIYNEWSSMKFYIVNCYCNYNDLLLRL